MAAVYALLGNSPFRYAGRHSSQQKPAEPLRGDASEATTSGKSCPVNYGQLI